MKQGGRLAGIAAALVSLTTVGAAPPARAPVKAGLCATGETPLFQCDLGQKQAALCAAGKTVRYRYGAPDRVELVFPDQAKAGAKPLRWAMTGYSGGGEMQVNFENDGVTYIVYSRMVRTNFKAGEPNNPRDILGVAVKRGDKLLSDRTCKAGAIKGGHTDWIDEAPTRALLPEGEFIYAF